MPVPLTSSALSPGFNGVIRLFPLPILVLFPHVVQPLHIFEPRYCELLADALAHDGLIAMALLLPGCENDYEGRAPIASVACLGRIISHDSLPKGKHNIVLRGLRRVAILLELPPLKSFRRAEAEVLLDHCSPERADQRAAVLRQFLGLTQALVSDPAAQAAIIELPGVDPAFSSDSSCSNDRALGMMTDILSYSFDLSLADKLRLLADSNVDRRAAFVLEHLARLPPFHLN